LKKPIKFRRGRLSESDVEALLARVYGDNRLEEEFIAKMLSETRKQNAKGAALEKHSWELHESFRVIREELDSAEKALELLVYRYLFGSKSAKRRDRERSSKLCTMSPNVRRGRE
jgi:hypothetical protein